MGPVDKTGTVAGVGGLNRPLLGRTDFRSQRLEQAAAAVSTVTTMLRLLILLVFVIQQGFKIGRAYKFVLYVSQDCRLTHPTVSKAHRQDSSKEQAVPIITSRVTLPRSRCTFPDLRMSSLQT